MNWARGAVRCGRLSGASKAECTSFRLLSCARRKKFVKRQSWIWVSAIMTNRAHSEAILPRPVPMVPVAKPRGKTTTTSPPSQSTPHYANQTTANHSGIFHIFSLHFTTLKFLLFICQILARFLPDSRQILARFSPDSRQIFAWFLPNSRQINPEGHCS